MKTLTCEMCGSTNLIKEGDVFVCQSCGTKYSVEEAKKIMVEGTVEVKGQVSIDKSNEVAALLESARRAKQGDLIQLAQEAYQQAFKIDPTNWEANYYVAYFHAKLCADDYIEPVETMIKCLKPTVGLIKEHVINEEERRSAIEALTNDTIDIAQTITDAFENQDDSLLGSMANSVDSRSKAYIRDILLKYGDIIKTTFPGKYNDLVLRSWKYALSISSWEKEKIVKHIKDLDPTYEYKKENSGGCYVATAIYGSYNCPQVWTLRRFRDFTLNSTWYGRLFIKAYYDVSPIMVKWFGNTVWFKKAFTPMLDRMVARLQREGVESTPYDDKY